MKNQYVGDIGDYGKLGLLRQLKGFKLGVNWYLTDSLQVDYLNDEYIADKPLHEALKELVNTDKRTVSALEPLLPDATFYGELLDTQSRKEWHKKALEKLKGCELIFLDPDNGLEISKQDSKHVNYTEVADYFKAGASVIIYQHNDHRGEQGHIARCDRLCKEIPDCKLICLSFTGRDFIFVIQPKHYETLDKQVQEIVTKWNGRFGIK
ncbi:MAG: hypothetical protein LBV04_01785 [Deferribacteraceae bacterium]|jgi:hypothetical protein|nr:hypothetical protein [Deferribacteraceae bacterium]